MNASRMPWWWISGRGQRFTPLSAIDEVRDQRIEALRVLDHRAVAGVVPDNEFGTRDELVQPGAHPQRQQAIVAPPQDQRRATHMRCAGAGVVAQRGLQGGPEVPRAK